MVRASAPGKFILFGEHAVVYGRPAVAMAVNRRITVTITPADTMRVDGRTPGKTQSYVENAVSRIWTGNPLNVKTGSRLPPASGLGSSAALTVATVAGLLQMQGNLSEEEVARQSFITEYEVQGQASPVDTSTATHGSGILVLPDPGENLLWEIEKNGKRWAVHGIKAPEMTFVVGHTGVRSSTAEMVAKVRHFVENNRAGMDIIDEIAAIALEGVKALNKGDKQRVGELMNENQKLLFTLGVSHPSLEKLIDAAEKYSYGAKLTGAGGGGSMVALTDEPEKVMREIEIMGGRPISVRVEKEGVRIEGR